MSDRNTGSGDVASLVAILRSSADLEKLLWRTWSDGKSGTATNWESTKVSYRAGQPIRLEFKVNKGVSILELSAKTIGSDDWSKLIAQVYQP